MTAADDSGSSPKSWDRSVFDRIYAGADDPWDFEGSDYERAKYAETLAALPRAHFANCLEVGCSIGVQTRLLAARCAHVLGIDIAPEALRRARMRCADLDNVELRLAQIPQDWPTGSYDLIVLSEVLYFLDPGDIARTASLVLECTAGDAAVLLVNWVGETNTPTTGDEAAGHFIAGVQASMKHELHRRHDTYRLDLLIRA